MACLCDFCSAPDAGWRHPARSFIGYVARGVVGESVGDWAACQECHQLIVSGDRARLTERSVVTFIARHPELGVVKTELATEMGTLHAQLLRESYRSSIGDRMRSVGGAAAATNVEGRPKMRLEGRMRLGYYPLDQREAQRMRRFLQFPNEPASALDPCAGTGAALVAITENSCSRRYGIELDSHRALEARTILDEVIQGNAFDAKAPVESFSLLYLNPPYDFEVGEGKNQRMEKLFLEEFFRWLKPGGVLAMVIPFDRIYECRNILSPHFKDKAIYRLTEPEAERYKQAVVFGVRRSATEKNRLSDQAVNQANWKLQELTRRYDEIPPLPDEADRAYAVPQSGPVRMEYRGLPLDLVEDLLEKSPAWLQAQRVTHAQRKQFFGRPLTPLHAGHVGLCAVSGLLNGVFGSWSRAPRRPLGGYQGRR